MKIQKAEPPRTPTTCAPTSRWATGTGRSDDIDKATATWHEGPGSCSPTNARAQGAGWPTQGDELKTLIDDALDPAKRVDTDSARTCGWQQ